MQFFTPFTACNYAFFTIDYKQSKLFSTKKTESNETNHCFKFSLQNLVRASYVTYSGLLLTRYGKAAVTGFTILLQHLCYAQDGLVGVLFVPSFFALNPLSFPTMTEKTLKKEKKSGSTLNYSSLLHCPFHRFLFPYNNPVLPH